MTQKLRRLSQVFCLILFAFVSIALWFSLAMPGPRLYAKPTGFSAEQLAASKRMETHVRRLATEIGPRHVGVPTSIEATLAYMEADWSSQGFVSKRHRFGTWDRPFYNLELAFPGTKLADEWVVIGAHYDTEPQTPGANDNASGIAVLLELARRLRTRPMARSVRLVAFANEEAPWGMTENMGSVAYARRCRQRGEAIHAMISMDSVGYFSDEPGSQRYPRPLGLYYGQKGDYLALVGDWSSAWLVRKSIRAFRAATVLPSEGSALPRIFRDIARSDHSSFWRFGYSAMLVTDTAPFRDPNYHRSGDRPQNIDFERLSLVAEGIEAIIFELASTESSVDEK